MASTQPLGGNTRLGRLLGDSLDKIIKNVAWRKHNKLVIQCKAVLDKLPTLADFDTLAPEASCGFLYSNNTGFTPSDEEFLLQPLFMALETGSAKVVEPAVNCIQKLIIYSHLRGEVDSQERGNPTLFQLLELVCKCDDMGDDNMELVVLKTLLSAVTSASLHIHGNILLQIVRTCYNIYLGSKKDVNQVTAKASLIQMLIIVLRRMEADSSTVPVQPIVVADLMEPPEKSPNDTNVLQFVQNFISKVIEDIEGVLSPASSLKSLGHDDVFESAAASSADPADLSSELSDKDMLDAKYWEIGIFHSAIEGKMGELPEADAEKDGNVEVHITNKLRRDAFLVFSSLCKLSVKMPSEEGSIDSLLLRGKVLSMELLKILLENAGSVFQTSKRFLGAIKQCLCLSLLKNSTIQLTNIFQLNCSIFMSLVSRFRAGLKAEIGVFFPMLILRILENVSQPNVQQRLIVLRFLGKLCTDSQILVDIFVNYDCDVEYPNIFERLVNGLLKTAQGVHPGAITSLSPAQDAIFKLEAIKCLVEVCESLGVWMDRQLRIPDSHLPKTCEMDDGNWETINTAAANGIGEDAVNGMQLQSDSSKDTSEAAAFEQRRAYKLELQEGVSLFNRKPSKGIRFLINAKKIEDTPEGIATFLKKTSGLDQTMIGDYLGEREGLPLRVMHAYVDSFNFEGMEFDQAIRSLLQGFRLPGEAQKIDRIMEKFSERYCKCNPNTFTSADTAYVLAYSVILLNTDAHNPMVKNKMSKADFIRNNRGIDDGKDLPEDYLGSLYDRIVKYEIKMKADTLTLPSEQPANGSKILGLDSILNLVIRKRGDDKLLQKNDELIRHMQEQFKAKTGKSASVYHAATDVEILRFMLDVCWAPMLAAFSVTLGQTDDEVTTFQCLQGFRHAIHATAVMGMQTQRDAFVTSLAKFTSLHSAADIKQKNVAALKAIITIADEDGNYLQEAWEHILTCLSRFEQLHLLGEGAPPDATFFTAPQNESEKTRHLLSSSFHLQKRKGPGQLQHAAAATLRGSYDSVGVGVGVGGHSSGIVTAEQMNSLVSNLNMLEQIGNFEMNCIFIHSQRLNSEAIVDFVKALCKVSMEELRSPTDPRVFSLTKIVEIAHYNMNRIRLVWSSIWNVLSNFFVTVGCSENLSVAIFVMDSLRQLAMKFLDREELANYNFQNEFMKPFVIVMQKSNSVEIRELVIRCVSQMVLARVNNIKSGWKSMFMVFTIAASDDRKNIVLLAFETIEKIVRDYFPYITETETTTFTDCVNCLVAFMNSRSNKDISLNAIAFLRFCALKLAEGRLISSAKSKDKENPSIAGTPLAAGCNGIDSPTFTDKDDHLYFWFPLLAGFSKLTLDPRPDIRKSALQTLFDTLQHHGHLFSPALWQRVFESVLLPMFDHVRQTSGLAQSKLLSNNSNSKYNDLDEDAWISETCTLALQLVVDLFVKFYDSVNPLLMSILKLLVDFIEQPIQNLAGIGVSAFIRLMNNAGSRFSDENWHQVFAHLKTAAAKTVPDYAQIVYSMVDFETSGIADKYFPKSSSRVVAYGTLTTGEAEDRREDIFKSAVNDAKCRTAVQQLLIQVIIEIYNKHGGLLSAANTKALLDILYSIAVHAHDVNCDYPLRLKLQEVSTITQNPEPPLLGLESESYQALLKLLQSVAHYKPILAKDIEVETRLVQLCEDVLQAYINAASSESYLGSAVHANPHMIIPLSSARRGELASRAPLVVSTLKAISQLMKENSGFERYISRFFPLLASLVSCEHGSGDVQHALRDILSSCIGPILLQA